MQILLLISVVFLNFSQNIEEDFWTDSRLDNELEAIGVRSNSESDKWKTGALVPTYSRAFYDPTILTTAGCFLEDNMKNIIEKIISLWDPYCIYVFPEDEYKGYAEKIFDFVKTRKKISLKELTDFAYATIPPIEKPTHKFVALVEYERFAKIIISILEGEIKCKNGN